MQETIYTNEIDLELTEQPIITEKDMADAINLCEATVTKYQQLGWTQFTRDELISAGYEGICEATVLFDPNKGTVKRTKFTSYAYFWIRKYIQEYIAKNKTMASGSISECYRGDVGYTQSIDAYATNPDTGGIDHLGYLACDSENIEEILSNQCLEQERKDLLAEMFSELSFEQSLVYKLYNGIGTVDGEPMTIREIASAMECSIGKVHGLIKSVTEELPSLQAKYAERFANIY